MARHRSPVGRAHRTQGAHRSSSLPIPLRGAAVAAVTGGALSLIAGTTPPVPPGDSLATLRLTAGADGSDGSDGSDKDHGKRDHRDRDTDRRPSVEPVSPDLPRFDAGKLVESVTRAEKEHAKAAQRRHDDDERKNRERDESEREKALDGGCTQNTSGLGAVKAHVRKAAGVLGCRFGKPVMYGVAGRGGPSDHPGGLAIDFMVNPATGNALAQCALDNMGELGVKYVIWKQRINFGNGWNPMSDRGGITANHFDHVHVSFNPGVRGGRMTGC